MGPVQAVPVIASPDGINAVGVADGDNSAAATAWRWDPIGEYDIVLEDDALHYHRPSVLMHELGHLLGYSDDEGPRVMHVAAWQGPGTVFSGVDG
jgi:hypothetical protein